MASKYVPLFSIQLLHNYFQDNACASVMATPDSDTVELMQHLQIKWKQVGNIVLAYILSDPSNPAYPFVYPDASDVFRFSLSVTDSTFFNYTNLCGWGRSNNDLYYFSNQANNVFGSPSEHYLSQVIGTPAASVYNKGTLYNLSGTIYEAAQYPSVSDGPLSGNSYNFMISGGITYPAEGLNESDYLWYNRGVAQSFVSSQDVCQMAGNSYNFTLPGASTLNYTNTSIFAYNVTTNAYDILVTNPPIYQVYGSNVPTSCQVNLQGLPSGLYQVVVNGFTQNLFVDNSGELSGGLGVIEIYAAPDYTNSSPNTYQLFYNNALENVPANAPDGSLMNPTYTVQFANNLLYWQYIPAIIPSGSTPGLNYISFGNIRFFNFSGAPDAAGNATSDSTRWGSSLLMIPLVEAIPGTTSPYALVYPQATGPPGTTGPPWGSGTWGNVLNLPLAQVVRLKQSQDSGSGSGSGLVSQLLVSQNYLNVF